MSIDLVVDEQTALGAAWQLQRTGNFVAALDMAQESLRRWPNSSALQYLRILALASCGSTQAALDGLRDSALTLQADEDSQALEARLLKDLAFGGLHVDQERLVEAAVAYQEVARRSGGSYSAQNAALLYMLAGDAERARGLSAAVLTRLIPQPAPPDEETAYFHWATLAEAALVMSDQAVFTRALAAANPLCRRNAWARSRTLQQMARLTPLLPEFATLIKQWYQPPVGLILSDETAVPWEEGEDIDANDIPALAYGFEPASAPRLQELAARGIQVHCIYPHLPEGELGGARNASGRFGTHTWSSLLLDDVNDWQACAQTALGLSLGLADELRAPWVVLARRANRWRTYHHIDRAALRAALAPAVPSTRSSFAFLFADAVSYSSLSAADTQRYWTRLLPRTAALVLQRHAAHIVLKKTWGDAVHAVFTSATAAAQAALQIQEATAGLSDELTDGPRLSFRIAVHFGAADQGMDPVERLPSVFGPQLSLAARIEPVAPPGSVFVTEAFAAQLSLDDAHTVRYSYVGTTRLAKSYANLRLLRLAQGPAWQDGQRGIGS